MLNDILKCQNKEYVHKITKELSLIGNDGGKMGFRCSGSTGEWHTSDRIAEEMKKIGLRDVAVETFPVQSWEPLDAYLEIDGIKIPACPYAGTTGTDEKGIQAQIVDVGKGTFMDYEGGSIKGKIVFCSFDMIKDYWVNYPAYQAMQKGASAFICCYEGSTHSLRDEAIGCFDSQMITGLPVVNISRKSGAFLRSKLATGKVEGILKVDVKMNMRGKSSNVIGYYPGKDPSKMIVLAGHMDGYFNTYQDDVLAIGINLDIVKSLIETGYKPEHTVVVVAHGSEEYGISGSKYDWCTGSWYNVNVNHPEWFGKAVALLNIDAVRPDTRRYNIACTPEWRSFFKTFLDKMRKPPESVWPEGAGVTAPKGAWADGYNYSNIGVPELICGGGESEWSALNYHTQFDDYTIYEYEKKLIEYVTANYTEIFLEMDKMILPPLDFSHTPKDLLRTLAEIPSDAFEEKTVLKDAAESLIIEGSKLYEVISKINDSKFRLNQREVQTKRHLLLRCYKMIHKDLMGLAVDDSVIFSHEAIVRNINSIDQALEDLKRNDPISAALKLYGMDLFKISYLFDEPTYRRAMSDQDSDRDDLYWGTGKLHKFADTFKVAEALHDKNNNVAILLLSELRKQQGIILKEVLERETRIVNEIIACVRSIF